MKNRCLYCGNDTDQGPCQLCFPPNVDRAQLAKLGAMEFKVTKDKAEQQAIKRMINELEIQ